MYIQSHLLGLFPGPLVAQGRHGRIERVEQIEGGLVCSRRRLGQRVGRVEVGEVTLVERKLADGPGEAWAAVEHVFELVRVCKRARKDRSVVILLCGSFGSFFSRPCSQ